MKNLFFVLQSVEMIAIFHVLAILHLTVTIPHQWLASKCGELREYNFGLYNLCLVAIADDGKLILKEDFMRSIFVPTMIKVKPLKEDLQFMFEVKHTLAVGFRISYRTILLGHFDLIRSSLSLIFKLLKFKNSSELEN